MDINLSVVDQRVSKLASLHGERLRPRGSEDARRSAAFVLLCMQTLLNIDTGEALGYITEGTDDAGVDGLHVGDVMDREFTVALFQGKYQKRTDGQAEFGETEIKKLLNAVSVLFDPDRPLTLNQRLHARVEEIRSLISDGNIPTVRVILCNNGRSWNQKGQQLIDNAALQRVSFEHVNHDTIVQLLQRQQPVKDTINLAGPALVDNFNRRRVLLGKVTVTEITALFQRHGDRLLDRNVRRWLGFNWVNQGIRHTLLSPRDRDRFYFFNNGITAICSKFRHNALQREGWQVPVEDLQIINGGQTCKTIERILSEHPDEDFSQVHVLLRIYEIDQSEDDLVARITIATNSQSPVDLIDLHANDEQQRTLELALKDLGYPYLRKDDVLTPDWPESLDAPFPIRMGHAAEAVFSIWRRKPHQAKFSLGELFRNYYDEIFTPQLTAAQVIVAVTILMRTVKRGASLDENSPEQAPRYLPYAAYFLAMLIGEHLLRDLRLTLEQLTHRNLPEVLTRLKEGFDELHGSALRRLEDALLTLHVKDASLQRLAGTFRRADLLVTLNERGQPLPLVAPAADLPS